MDVVKAFLNSLSEEEHKQFRRFLKSHIQRKASKLLALYETYRQYPNLKTPQIVQLIYGEVNKQNSDAYRSLKRELKKVIERYIFFQKLEQDPSAQVLFNSVIANYLLERYLFHEALHYIDKSLNLVHQHEIISAAPLIYLQRFRMTLRTEVDSLDNLWKDYQTRLHYFNRLGLLHIYQRKIVAALTLEQFDKADKLYAQLNQEMPPAEDEPLELHIRRALIQAQMYRYKKQIAALVEFLQSFFAKYEEKNLEKHYTTRIPYYILRIYEVEALIYLGQLKQAQEYFSYYLSPLTEESHPLAKLFRSVLVYYEFLIDFYLGAHHAWRMHFKQFVEKEMDIDLINALDKTLIYALLLYLGKRYKEAQQLHKKIQSLELKRNPLLSHALFAMDLLRLIIAFEEASPRFWAVLRHFQERYKKLLNKEEVQFHKPLLEWIKEAALKNNFHIQLNEEQKQYLQQLIDKHRYETILLLRYPVFLPLWLYAKHLGISYEEALMRLQQRQLWETSEVFAH